VVKVVNRGRAPLDPGVIINRMNEPERRSHRRYTTGRLWLDVLLAWSAILFCIVAAVVFIRIGLPFVSFYVWLFHLHWLIAVVIGVVISVGILWTSRHK
jgi:hypothetical protein